MKEYTQHKRQSSYFPKQNQRVSAGFSGRAKALLFAALCDL
ncbi:hypothetical protein [Neotabrizicola sp. VNH66]